MQRLVLASDNVGKLRELCALLTPLSFEIVPQGALGICGADEPHATFVENALAKARHAARLSGSAALADDSGLCCHALGGEPGVRSARFAGEPSDDGANNAALLRRLCGVSDRRAHYVCVLVLCRSMSDPEPLIAEGRWFGRIGGAPRGTSGFGYDPVFEPFGYDCSAAELAAEVKNRISHRALALGELADKLRGEGRSE